MDALETYQCDAVERPLIRRRLFWALVISLALHIAIILWFRRTNLPHFSATTERLVPRVFSVRTITIDEKLLKGEDEVPEPGKIQPPQSNPSPRTLDIPDETPSAGVTDVRLTPSAAGTPPEEIKPVVNERPIPGRDVPTIARMQDNTARLMEQDLASLRDSLLKDQPPTGPNALIHIPDSTPNIARSDASSMAAASSRLDALLGRGIRSGDAPVTMPGGAMFEFDSAALLPAAIDQLRKLGRLIKQNPNVTFNIEGFTDSFGDTAYNQQLSQARADAVRSWLIQNMDVDPSHIQASGYGATNFVVAPQTVDMHSQASIDREKALEQPNRRVEIRFQFSNRQ